MGKLRFYPGSGMAGMKCLIGIIGVGDPNDDFIITEKKKNAVLPTFFLTSVSVSVN
jgi:hypothetical protein